MAEPAGSPRWVPSLPSCGESSLSAFPFQHPQCEDAPGGESSQFCGGQRKALVLACCDDMPAQKQRQRADGNLDSTQGVRSEHGTEHHTDKAAGRVVGTGRLALPCTALAV